MHEIRILFGLSQCKRAKDVSSTRQEDIRCDAHREKRKSALNYELRPASVLEFDPFRSRINEASLVAPPLLFVLLFREALALRSTQIPMGAVSIVVRYVFIRREPRIDLQVLRDPTERLVAVFGAFLRIVGYRVYRLRIAFAL